MVLLSLYEVLLPGDRVIAKIMKKKRGFANANIVEILIPSSDRIDAPCPYHGYCGGCNYQHLDYRCQVKYKKGHVSDSIKRIGGAGGGMHS